MIVLGRKAKGEKAEEKKEVNEAETMLLVTRYLSSTFVIQCKTPSGDTSSSFRIL